MKRALDQNSLASKLGVTTNYVSLIENEKKDPSFELLKKISKVLRIPIILLAWDKMSMPAAKNREEKKILSELRRLAEDAQEIFFRHLSENE